MDAIERLIGTAIPKRKLEGIEVRENAPRHQERRAHGRHDSGRQRPIKPHGQVAKMESLSQQPSAPTHAPAAPAEVRTVTASQPAQKQAPLTVIPKEEKATPDGSRLPAFVFRPVPLPKSDKPAAARKKLTAES